MMMCGLDAVAVGFGGAGGMEAGGARLTHIYVLNIGNDGQTQRIN
jgi:hypothetical protein